MSDTPLDPDTGAPFVAEAAVRIAAPRPAVWRAVTEASLFGRWFVCDWGEATSLDPVPGGKYEIRGQTPSGGGFVCSGEVTAVTENERLELTFEWSGDPEIPDSTTPETWPTAVTVALREVGEETIVVLAHAGLASAESRDGHTAGAYACLEHLAKLVG